MPAESTEFKEIDELDDIEYDWFCNECHTIFDGRYAVMPHDGICDPCLIKKITTTPKLVEDIPF